MFYRLVFALAVIILLIPLPLAAQDLVEDCTTDMLAEQLTRFDQLLADASAALEEDDPIAALDTLTLLRAHLATLDATCWGFVFEDDAATVLGPVYLPVGLYRVTVTTPGFFIADTETLSGTCGPAGWGGLFNITRDRATTGAETVFRVEEPCTFLILTSNVSEPYTLSFEALTP